MRGANLIVAMMAVCVALLACKKDKEDEGKAKDAVTAASAAAEAKKPEAPSKKYQSGDVLNYMPKECTKGRFFVSVNKLIGPSKQAVDDMLRNMLTGTDKDTTEAREVVDIFKAGGIELTRDIQEIAVCAGYKGRDLFAVGFHADQIKSGDVLDLISKAAQKVDNKTPVKATEAGVPVLKKNASGRDGFALMSPTVVLFVEQFEHVADAKQGGGAAEFKDAPAQVFWGYGEEDGDKYTVKATPKGADIELRLEILPKGKSPDDLKVELEGLRGEALKEMAGSPFADFADDAKKVTFAVEGAQVVAMLTIARSRLDALLKKGSTMKPEELMRAF